MTDFVNLHDFETAASNLLQPAVLGYYKCGADNQLTLADNCNAFQKIRMRPRNLVDVSERSTACNVLGFDLKMPIGIAPTASHALADFTGEAATAKAAGAAGTIYIQSSFSTQSIEEVAAAAPDTIKWFQLYIFKRRSISESLIRRAEGAGFKAIVLTIDQPHLGKRVVERRAKFALPNHLQLGNYIEIEKQYDPNDFVGSRTKFVHESFNDALTWKDVQWLIGFTKLPVIVKGVLIPEDAVIAADCGCSGIIVSNHGARQLDTVLATINALPAVVKAVGHRLPVMMDGGIREGTDVFKAIAYGAQCVFVGRPIIWGLTVAGQAGIERVLEILREDFDRAMALSGTATVADISSDYLTQGSKL